MKKVYKCLDSTLKKSFDVEFSIKEHMAGLDTSAIQNNILNLLGVPSYDLRLKRNCRLDHVGSLIYFNLTNGQFMLKNELYMNIWIIKHNPIIFNRIWKDRRMGHWGGWKLSNIIIHWSKLRVHSWRMEASQPPFVLNLTL